MRWHASLPSMLARLDRNAGCQAEVGLCPHPRVRRSSCHLDHATCRALLYGGDFQGGLNEIDASIPLYRECGNVQCLANALSLRGFLLTQVGRHQEALAPLLEAVRLSREADGPHGEATALANLAAAYYHNGDNIGSLTAAVRGCKILFEIGDPYQLGLAFLISSAVPWRAGEMRLAYRIQGHAARVLGELANAVSNMQIGIYDVSLATREEDIEDTRLREEWRRGYQTRTQSMFLAMEEYGETLAAADASG